MIKNYLKVAFRNMRKWKVYTFINLTGLAVGMVLLSREFIKWVILANLIALPVAYYFMNERLEDFAYRIDITWWMFALSGGIALVIALLTVSVQAVKAAIANPVESLRYE
jgi:putative ABC transport system permease protein